MFISKQKMWANGVCCSRLPKSQTSPGKAVMIFWESVFGEGPLKGFTGLLLFEMAAPNSSMALSYEHSSV